MKPQKLIAGLMILTSSAITAWTSVDIAYPAILCMLGLLGLQRRFTWDIKPERRVITSLLMLLLAMLFALHYRYSGPPGWNAHEEVVSMAWQTVTRFFLAAMILILFLGSPQRLPLSLGLFHLANAVCAGQVLLLNDRFITFRLLELLSVVLAVLYAATTQGIMTMQSPRARRTPRWLVGGVILAIAANGGWIVSSVLYRHVEVLDYIPMWIAKQGVALERAPDAPAHVAFSNSGTLSSIREIIQDQDTVVALTIRADRPPGYLRARAFERYDQSQWRSALPKETIVGQPSMKPIKNNLHVFRFRTIDASDLKSMTLRYEAEFDAGTAFSPLGMSALKVLPKVVQRDDHDIIYVQKLGRRARQRLDYSTTAYREPPPEALRARMLEVPLSLDPQANARVADLAKKIFVNADTTREKIEAVVHHFRTHYAYSLQAEIPPGRDPLTYFLFEGSTGYCEYFASGAALLLRTVGVPTRYVTGYLVTERDPQTGFWVARNMDAHAWVEAWDQQRQEWAVVEATVQEDRVAGGVVGQLGRLGSGISVSFSRFLQAVYDYGLLGAASWLLSSYGVWATAAFAALFLTGVGWWIWFRRRRKTGKGPWRSKRIQNPSLVALHKMLARMDRRLRGAGLRRHVTETLHAFAGRLRARAPGDERWGRLSDWYLEYADLRYRRSISAEHLERLQQRADGLRRSL